MTASSIMQDIMRRYDVPMSVAIDQAVAKSQHGRAPQSVRSLMDSAVPITHMPSPLEALKDLTVVRSHRQGYGKTYIMQQQVARLRAMGYQVVLHQAIGEPTVLEAKSGADTVSYHFPDEWRHRLQRMVDETSPWDRVLDAIRHAEHTGKPLILKPPMRRDYYGEVLQAAYLDLSRMTP